MASDSQQVDSTSLSWWGNVRRDNYDEVCQRNAQYKEQRLDLFRAVKKVLDARGICYWIDGGTLLGSFRNGTMIPHDDDTDFGVMEQEQFDRMVEVLRADLPDIYDVKDVRSYCTKVEVGLKDCDKIQLTDEDEWSLVSTDIYLYQYDDERFVRQQYFNFDLNKRKFSPAWIFPLSSTTFEGIACPCPRNAQAYLECMYGYTGEDFQYDPEKKAFVRAPAAPTESQK